MSDPGNVPATPPAGHRSDRAARIARRYLLPAIGGGAAAFGALSVAGIGSLPPSVLPVALLGTGLVCVASAIVLSPADRSAVEPSTARVARRRGEAPPPPRPPTSLPRRRPLWADARPHSGLGRAAVAAPPLGDRGLWGPWETTPTASPDPSWSGSAVEPSLTQGRPGVIAPWSVRGRDEIVISEAGSRSPRRGPSPTRHWDPDPDGEQLDRWLRGGPTPAGSAATSLEPYSEADLDLLFPPEADPRPPTVDPPAGPVEPPLIQDRAEADSDVNPERLDPLSVPIGSPEPGPAAPSVDYGALSWGAPGLGVEFGLPDHELYLEAINPVPPHLRAPTASPARAPEPPELGFASSGRCSVCADPVSGFRAWTPCPRCFRPVCRECLTASLHEGGSGECASCRPEARAHAA